MVETCWSLMRCLAMGIGGTRYLIVQGVPIKSWPPNVFLQPNNIPILFGWIWDGTQNVKYKPTVGPGNGQSVTSKWLAWLLPGSGWSCWASWIAFLIPLVSWAMTLPGGRMWSGMEVPDASLIFVVHPDEEWLFCPFKWMSPILQGQLDS